MQIAIEFILDLDLFNNDYTKGKKMKSKKEGNGQGKILEDELKAFEGRYRDLFERVRHGLFISTNEGKFFDCNRAMLDMLAYESKEEFMSIDIERDLYVNSEDRKKFQRVIDKEGYVKDYEICFKKKTGEEISVLITCDSLLGSEGKTIGYQGLNIDITERKRMEKEIREAHQFLSKLIESSLNPVVATDMQGNIIIFNKGAEELLGYTSENVIGKMSISEIYPPGVAKEVIDKIRGPDYGGAGVLKFFPMVQKNRRGYAIEGSLSASIIYNEKGNEIAIVSIFTDLSPMLKMEKQLREIQEQLLQSEKIAAMGRLTSQIAHELNNPLYGIMNTLELMKTEISPQNKRRKILEMALSETARLAEMLRKMLSFSKPDQEKRQITDINTIIDEILLLHEKQLQELDIRVSSFFAEGLGKVYASKNQLRQVFLNMISNARDAMPNGGTLILRTQSVGDKVQIEISDTGIGIKKTDLDKIFEAFFTTKDNLKDVGLGLSVCYGFIKDHGGEIKVKRNRGPGTTFTIILPVCKETKEDKDLN